MILCGYVIFIDTEDMKSLKFGLMEKELKEITLTSYNYEINKCIVNDFDNNDIPICLFNFDNKENIIDYISF